MTTIVNIKKEKYTLYIGRRNLYYNQPIDSIFANPFVIGKDGTREEVIRKFKDYAINNKEIMDNLYLIDNEILGCYCAPDFACHGEILIELRKQQQLIEQLGERDSKVIESMPNFLKYHNKVIIAGSRTINNYKIVECCINEVIKQNNLIIDEIVCGEARGVDSLGKQYGINYKIPVKSFFAKWEKFGKSAGYIRNEEMAKYSTHLILIWNGLSKGSRNMFNIAEYYGLKIFEKIIPIV
jgi:hypothetical protein